MIKSTSSKSGFIRFLGKGGLGVVTAARLFFRGIMKQYGNPELTGRWRYAPGAERRGSEISADGATGDMDNQQLLKIIQPPWLDTLVIFDEDMLRNKNSLSDLRSGGRLITNSSLSAEELVEKYPHLGYFNVWAVPATESYKKAYRQKTGKEPSAEDNRPNGPMDIAAGVATGLVGVETMYNVIVEYWGNRAAEITLLASQIAYGQITHTQKKIDGEPEFEKTKAKKIFREVPIAAPDWGSGGFTGLWRMGMNYYIDLKECKRCGTCAEYCPEDVIDKFMLPYTDKDTGFDLGGIAIDQLYCKGCGICKNVCPYDAIKKDHMYENMPKLLLEIEPEEVLTTLEIKLDGVKA